MTFLYKIISAYVSLFLVFSPLANADESVTTLQVGEPAPFAGTLFSTEAAARILIDLELTGAACQIETDRQLGLLRAELQFEIDTKSAALESCQSRYLDIVNIKNDQILFLETQIERQSNPHPELWLAIGIVGGILLTGAAGWTMGQISNNSQSN
jgi:hypothetical protein